MWVGEGFSMVELDGENTGLFEIKEHQSGDFITLSADQLKTLARIVASWDRNVRL